ncbi:hypothetical protein VCSRO186_1815 [Vibrio cholerae]|nr:hypothetical protein VCSRO186_1815 [Vibrio cholerae]
MNQTVNSPKGQLLLRTLAMPADTNANGDIFGGWIMSQLDLAGGILAKEISCGRIVTVSVSSITFKKPVKVGGGMLLRRMHQDWSHIDVDQSRSVG